MAVEFTAEDLALGLRELEKLKLALANRGLTERLAQVIADAVAQVDLYTQGYTLTEAHYRRLVRGLAVYEAYRLAAGATEEHRKGYDDALKEITAIRDGKFPGLATSEQEAGETAPARGNWGSRDKIL